MPGADERKKGDGWRLITCVTTKRSKKKQKDAANRRKTERITFYRCSALEIGWFHINFKDAAIQTYAHTACMTESQSSSGMASAVL